MNAPLTSDEALELANAQYDLGNIDYCMLLRRGFNDTYVFESNNSKYIFRVYLQGKYYVTHANAYRFELDLVEHLKKHDVPVATALPTLNGNFLGITQTRHGKRAFALFHYADGFPLSRESVTVAQSHNMGVALANLHLASNSFVSQFKRYKLDLKYLVDEPIRLITEKDQQDTPGDLIEHGRYVLKKLHPIEKYIDRVKSIGTDGDKFGIIHADMHLGNIHFRGEDLTIFDFDHCAYGWRAYDLAICYGLPKEKRASMIAGYESKRPLSMEERDSLQDLGNLRNLWDIGDTLATENLSSEIALI